jgi:succinate dehydrogenase / fumarate reductase cytochrome b subunit
MRRVVALYRSSVGKKVLMAVTGFIWFGFLIGHMAGNLKAFLGPEHFDEYAHFLRTVGTPLFPEYTLLWTARIILILALVIHVIMALQTWLQSSAARGDGYRKKENLSFSWSSQFMRWGGVLIAVFIVYHILHMTTGTLHPDFEEGAAYHNLVTGLSNPLVAGFYILAMAAICLHLWHGVWSLMQTLGANHPKYRHLRRPVAVAFAVVVFLGFISVPISVLAGILSL